MSAPDNFDELSSSQLRDLVLKLFSKIADLEKIIADQREEVARLKGLKGRPDIKPSGMDKGTEPAKRDKSKKQRNHPAGLSITHKSRLFESRLLPGANRV